MCLSIGNTKFFQILFLEKQKTDIVTKNMFINKKLEALKNILNNFLYSLKK